MASDFHLVDVFCSGPFSGNPVAVFDGEGLTTEDMQKITQWMNLSESTFLLPPTTSEADYRVRIFTLQREMPFAGHPTLGTCHAWTERTGNTEKDRVIQECGAGLVTVERREGIWAFAAPPLIRSGPVDEATVEEVAGFLRIDRSRILDARWCDNGPGWVGILLGSAEEVLALEPVRQYPKLMDVGVIGAYPDDSEVRFELRTFFSNHLGDIAEDPVTGSFNASAAQWMIGSGRATPPYIAAQGTRLGRQGRIHIDQRDGTLWIGGKTLTVAEGTSPIL